MNIHVNSDRLSAELDRLAAFSEVPAPAVTRIVFSPPDLEAREYVKGLARRAGLSVREDAVGNTFMRWDGTEPDAPAAGTGSHIDAIPHSGRYDGTVGVLGGLEAIRALRESGLRPRRSVELLMFTSEEPTRFGVGCLGSRLLSGTLPASADHNLKDSDGQTLAEVRQAAGFTGGLEDVRLPAGYYHAFVELHIEQGPLLEKDGLAAGIVTAIAAPATLRVVLEGQGGHAGAVLMPERRDALAAAADLVLHVEQCARDTGAIDTVATVGRLEVFPGAVNSIPSRVYLEIDIRDIDLTRRDAVLASIEAAANQIGRRRSVACQVETLNADAPAESSPAIVEALEKACEVNGVVPRRLVSRAYHDTLFVSRIAPVAMLFIPCRGGVSHTPDEYASPEDIRAGVLILAHTLAELAS